MLVYGLGLLINSRVSRQGNEEVKRNSCSANMKTKEKKREEPK
jgi:hypothetical protein